MPVAVIQKRWIVTYPHLSAASSCLPVPTRTLDDFTKRVLLTAYRLFDGDLTAAGPHETGAVIASDTGPLSSLRDTAALLRQGDGRRINPSLFPNVMLSTALSHLTHMLALHGPTSCYLEKADAGEALRYASTQIEMEHCRGMVYIRVDEEGWGEGKYLVGVPQEEEKVCG